MPPKNRKGKRGDDSDDDPLADQLAYLKTQQKPADEEPAKDNKAAKASKKDKKDNKKKGGKRDDSDDEDPLLAMKKLALSSDDEGASVPSSNVTADKGKKANNKKDKKDSKKKGGKKDDSDDEDPMLAMKKLAQSSDDEDEAPPVKVAAKPAAAPVDNKKSKKDSKKKGGKKNDSDDEDPMLAMKKLAQSSDDEEEEAPPTAKVDSKKAKKDNKKQDGKKGKAAAVREESEAEDSDAANSDSEPETPAPKAAAPVVPAVAVKTEEPVKEKKDKKSKKDKDSSSSSATAEPEAPTESLREIESKANAAKKAKAAAAQAAPTVEAKAAAAAATAAAADPNRKMSKLELKLEKARREKAEADAQAAIAAAAAAQAAAEEAERQRVEAAVLAEEQARLKAEQQQQEADEDSDSEDSDSEEEGDTGAGEGSAVVKTAEEQEREARMMSTMYGDDVFTEDRPGEDSAKTGTGATAAGASSGKKEKLSNKAKRKMAKEEEAKDREAEYNALALKASAEGAQFAVSQSVVNVEDPLWQNALDIIIPNLSVSAHKKELFVNAELSIVHGRRYGLVGPNGAGKSTLLKMIAAGQLKIPPRIDYLYVEQEVMADETPAVDAVLRADKVRWELIQEEKKIMAALAQMKGGDDKLDTRLGEVHAELAVIGAASAESRARRILFGLGFDAEMQTRPTKFFSGGWRMRISLARALFIEPTLLMLDEPTNHLDLNAVIWLDDYLQKWKKTLLIVSHDQEFLNSVCEEIIHLEDKKLIFYKGNYDNFKEQEAVRRKQVQKEYEKQEKKLRELKAKGITQKNAEKAQLKSKSREPGARSNKKAEAAAMASGGIESGESQLKLIERPRDYSVVFSFPEVVHLSPPIMEVRDVNFRYASHLPWLFRGLNFGLDMSSRVCIVGPNGSGKSTIIKLITNELMPPEGEVRRNPRLRVGVYNQHFVERLPMDEDPVTYLRRLFSDETYQSVRNKLGKYGLEGHAHTLPIRDLSGGQKARVVFVELSFMAPHLLFLDEPTNNLDIESIDALCIALREFNGGVVLVSHDARLIETTECQLWVVENQGLTPWENGFNNYRQHLLKQLEEQLNAIMPGSGERPK